MLNKIYAVMEKNEYNIFVETTVETIWRASHKTINQ